MEFFHVFGEDLVVSQNGDIGLVTGDEETKQRVLRRLLTAIKGYIWHTDYGAGLPSFVGQNFGPIIDKELRGLIKNQMYLEDTVKRNPSPQISLSLSGTNLICVIRYEGKPSGKVFTLSFTVSIES